MRRSFAGGLYRITEISVPASAANDAPGLAQFLSSMATIHGHGAKRYIEEIGL
jgi:hypothetical protein